MGYIDHFELVARTEARRITGGWKIGIYCPLTEADSAPHDEGGETSTVLRIIKRKFPRLKRVVNELEVSRGDSDDG